MLLYRRPTLVSPAVLTLATLAAPLRLLAEELGVPAIALPTTLLKGWQVRSSASPPAHSPKPGMPGRLTRPRPLTPPLHPSPHLAQPPDDFLPTSAHDPPSPLNVLLTASFGHLIPTSLLSLFRPLNALNVHPSLLPRWRGAAPIQRGIIAGDADGLTGEPMGVTVQELSRGKFDRGRILAQRAVVRSLSLARFRSLTS